MTRASIVHFLRGCRPFAGRVPNAGRVKQGWSDPVDTREEYPFDPRDTWRGGWAFPLSVLLLGALLYGGIFWLASTFYVPPQ